MRALSIATVFVAASGYFILMIAAKAMPHEIYQSFLVYWGMFFALTGLLDGLMQETARSVTAARSHDVRTPNPARPLRLTGIFGVAIGLVVLVTGMLWAPRLAPGQEGLGIGLMVLGLISYAFQAGICGLLSATHKWTSFGVLISVDSGVRLLLAVIAWLLGWQIAAFLIVTVLGAATWVVALAVSPAMRGLLSSVADVNSSAFSHQAFRAMIASGANAALITGFPVLLEFTSPASTAQGALAGTLTAVTLTRAPILVPLQRFQPALIVHFTKNRAHVLRASLVPIAAIAGISAVGAIAAWLIGPWLMGLFFPDVPAVAGWALGLLTLVAGASAILMVAGSAALSADRHTLYSVGWIVSTVVAIGLLLVDTSPEWRSILALGIGPLVGTALQLGVLSWTAPRATDSDMGASPLPQALDDKAADDTAVGDTALSDRASGD